MTKEIQWIDNGHTTKLKLTSDLALTVYIPMGAKGEPIKYAASLFGLKLTKRFDTENEAKKAVELKAQQLLKSGLANLEEFLKDD